jgi:hypothetical protein
MNHDTITPCIGYQKFFDVWIRTGNDFHRMPSEAAWEEMLEDPDKPENEFQMPAAGELLDIFPEALPIIKRNKKILHDYLFELDAALQDATFNVIIPAIYENGGSAKAVARATEFFYKKPLQKVESRIKQLDHLLRTHEWKRKPPSDGTITEADIARAKEFPIISIARPNRSGFIECPFHNEKTASCKVFPDNRWHCFGCSADGDVIDFVMKTDNLEFIPAVKKILGK